MRVGAQPSHQTLNLARVFDAGMDGACRRVHGEFGGVLVRHAFTSCAPRARMVVMSPNQR